MPDESSMPSLAIVSTYPPTACGLATFATSLADGLRANDVCDVGIVRALTDSDRVGGTGDSPSHDGDGNFGVVAELHRGDRESVARAADVLTTYDVVLLQHEYGIFGGDDGSEVLDLLGRLSTPVITTLHTVPLHPSRSQRRVLESVAAASRATVVMTEVARQRLTALYDVDQSRVRVVPHGAAVPESIPSPTDGPPTLLTWGLLGPGKGIEWVIDAIALLAESAPDLTYIVAGRIHPNVMAREGDAYRRMLRQRARDRGVAARVVFEDGYLSAESLVDLVSRATCVVLPYDSTDQITSGVLVDAVATGRPIIATRFPHAIELLADGAGILVPHADPWALASAARVVATDFASVAWMARRASLLAPRHRWTTVARSYLGLARAMCRDVRGGTPLASGTRE